jgi:hypothetical protein
VVAVSSATARLAQALQQVMGENRAAA